ncbi:MAG: hypothetical protein QOG89_1625 [Thermomicrobiales bacterium]|nr:hypothetical protein [Thermomicrobiales bacterium]
MVALYVYAEESTYGANIYGELLNTTDRPAAVPEIEATLSDEGGNALETIRLYAPFGIIPAGEKMGFEGSTQRSPEEWTELEVALSGGGPATESQIAAEPAGVEIRQVNEVTKTDTSLRVLGVIYNGAEGAVNGVVRALFYREDGRYAGSEYRLGNYPDLAPGQSGSFKITATVDAGPGWTYRLVPDVYPVSTMPPEVDAGVVEVVKGTPFAGTPAAARTGAELLYVYDKPGAYGGTRLFGEIRNTTDETLNSPGLYVTFYDGEDRIVDSITIYPLIGIAASGGTTPYDGSGDLPPDDWVRYTVRLGATGPAGIATIAAYPKGLEIRDVEETDRITTGVRLVGTVANEGEQNVTYASVLALFYRADGRYAGYKSARVEPDELAPGESGTFTLVANVDAGTDWTYRLIARGTPKS